MRARAIRVMTELSDAYAAIPPRHMEYIMSHMDEIADAALVAHCDMEAMQALANEVAGRITNMTPEEIESRNSVLRSIAKDIKV